MRRVVLDHIFIAILLVLTQASFMVMSSSSMGNEGAIVSAQTGSARIGQPPKRIEKLDSARQVIDEISCKCLVFT